LRLCLPRIEFLDIGPRPVYAKILIHIINFLFLFVLFSIFIPFMLEQVEKRVIYNSDLVHPYLLIGDLINDPNSLYAWYYSATLYVFPDWLLTAAVLTTGAPSAWLPLIYGAMNMALFSLAGGAVIAATGRPDMVAGSWMMALFLFVLGWWVIAVPLPEAISIRNYSQIPAPYVHTGAALATLLASALFLRQLFGQPGIAVAAVLVAITIVSSFSDPLFFVWFACPAYIAGLLYAWATGRGKVIGFVGLIAVTGLLGMGIEPLLRDVPLLPEGASLDRSLAVLRESLALSISQVDLPILLLLVLTLALLVRGAFLSVQMLQRKVPSRDDVLEVLLAGICSSAILAPFAANMIFDIGSWRYFIILMVVQPLWLAHLAIRGLNTAGMNRYVALIPVVLLAYCAVIAIPSYGAAKRLAGPGSILRCIEAEGRTAGLGDYWTAKELMFLSDRQIHIVQVNNLGLPRRWNYNERWFSVRADNGAPLRLDFIVPKRLDSGSMLKVFGSPDRITECGGEELWLYDKPLSFKPN